MSEEKKLLTIAECRDLPDEEVTRQIQLRHHWIDNVLMGWLYKSVLAGEIVELKDLLTARLEIRHA